MYERKFKTHGMSYAKCQTIVCSKRQKKTLNETTAQTTRSIHMHIVSNANFQVIHKMDLARYTIFHPTSFELVYPVGTNVYTVSQKKNKTPNSCP